MINHEEIISEEMITEQIEMNNTKIQINSSNTHLHNHHCNTTTNTNGTNGTNLHSSQDHHLPEGAIHLLEENERVVNEEKEIKEIYHKKNMEFHKKDITKTKDGSLLDLKQKGLVRERSLKFTTPDTASYTKPSGIGQISIQERIINKKKIDEKKKQEVEKQQREKVIILSNEPINNLSEILDRMNKPIGSVHLDENNNLVSISTSNGTTTVANGSTSNSANVASNTQQDQSSANSNGTDGSNTSQLKNGSINSNIPLIQKTVRQKKSLNRARRGRLELVIPRKEIGLEKNIQTYLVIPPNPVPAPKPTQLNQLISIGSRQFLKTFITHNTSRDLVEIVDHNMTPSQESNGVSSGGSKVGSKLLVDKLSDSGNGNGGSQILNSTSLRLKALKTSFRVLFILPNQSSKILQCKGSDTIEVLKDRLVSDYLQLYRNASNLKKCSPDSYAILDYNENPLERALTLNKSEYILQCRGNGILPKLKMIEKYQILDADPSAELTASEYETIRELIPNTHEWVGEEVDYFRRVTARLRYEEINNIKGTIQTTLQVKISPLPIPMSPVGGKIYISVQLPITQCQKTLEIIANETADQFTSRIFEKNYAKQLGPHVKPLDFILKAIGYSDYIHGPFDLRTFETVRQSIIHGYKANLILIQKPKIELDPPPFKPRFEFPPEVPTDYEVLGLSAKERQWDQITQISIRDIKRPLRFKVQRSSGIPLSNYQKKDDDSTISVIVYVALFHGVECISKGSTSFSTASPQSLFQNQVPSSVQWDEFISLSNIDYCNLPMDSRLCISVYATSQNSSDSLQLPNMTTNQSDQIEIQSNGKKDFPIGWVNLMVSDYKSQLRSGPMELSLWPDDVANPLGTCSQNQSPTAVKLFLEFEQFSLPVVFPHRTVKTPVVEPPTINSNDMREFFESIISLDPLSDLSKEKYQQLWALRHYSMLFPQVLPRLMLSVPWCQAQAVDEAHSFIDKWPKLKPYDALELLDAKHANRLVRAYAVSCLEELPEEELLDILLQLVQVLKYEPYHDSKLARFLLKKAILNRNIGHSFFWYLKSDLHVASVSERFGILLEAYLHACGTHRHDLLKQQKVIENLTDVAKKIKPLKDQDRREYMLRELESIEWPKRFHLTLNPKYESNGLIFQKCRYMDSKKLPLRLSFTNTDSNADSIEVIFKVGDDLRQDMLTLQMIRLMDKLWQKENLDLKLSPYGCISTGDMVGMIEVVLNSETTAKIQKLAGGATAAFKLDPLDNWLHFHNRQESDYLKAVDTFILSCAGYCVATYVLGIGDRHNDNLMCTKLGRLFHIDFGHFLGNYKKKFGIKRERAPFVFTPDFCFVMGGKESPKFLQFVNYCCTAYNILRKNAKLFMNLFAMMVSTGIPELQSMEDLNYLKESFSLELSDEKAREKFTALIHESLTTKTTQFNNAIHILAH
ncbi:phosphatidylinositol-4 [Tieghemostelium lacteum]|uniref:phosphatidylinositol 3-kinase n=1 Tax=Tieghemostelium lacteum TaxID=361077 RepID=A0A151ZSM6_TIELA|nr:phosphatidylinositol-4 [Tieghemostelium lacteum]|eukprot:KYQ96905.1 phosphatidylinositol-4 [Tieghemostelium lacteum]